MPRLLYWLLFGALFQGIAPSTLPFAADPASPETSPGIQWQTLQPGVEYSRTAVRSAAYIDAKEIHVVRVDPAVAEIKVLLASAGDRKKRTAQQWASENEMSVVINLGMFNVDDPLSHTGYLKHGTHLNSSKWVKSYASVLALNPNREGVPKAAILDLDLANAKDQIKAYDTVVQNLRLIRGAGQNVWSNNTRKWSEAALAIDDQNRLLFLFCRTPFTMQDFNRLILSLPLGIQRAMHLEGGPEASLSIRSVSVQLDLCGSYESGFWEQDSNHEQWPVPNVLGVKMSKTPSAP